IIVLHLTCFFLFFLGQQQNYEINQSPSDLLGFQEENSELQCKHSVSSLNMILWYRRSLNDTSMQLIAYVRYKNPNVETPYLSHFNVSGDGAKHSTLHLLKLSAAEHTAVYYCAASTA
ncbi:hypothetical protein C0J50_21490, partial [Silurus asotus]